MPRIEEYSGIQYERRKKKYPELFNMLDSDNVSFSISSLSMLVNKHEGDVTEARYWCGFDLESESKEWLKYKIANRED